MHMVLGLVELPHPHTGENLADSMLACLHEWNISHKKVLLIITDNGANIVKAVRIMNEKAEQNEQKMQAKQNEQEDENEQEDGEEDNSSTDDDDNEEYAEGNEQLENGAIDDNEIDDESVSDVLNDEMNESEVMEAFYTRMKCMAHSLQLVIKKAYKHYDSVIIKVRRLVNHIRKSGPATEKLKVLSGKFLITDNATRWNSTYMMIKRLLETKVQVNEVLRDMQIDSLLVAEWAKLEDIANLLEPFSTQTDILQTDTMSLSYAIPSLMELQCHLQNSTCAKSLTKVMLDDIRSRFDFILNPQSQDFIPIPAACCLLHPEMVKVLATPDVLPLFEAAKSHIISKVSVN